MTFATTMRNKIVMVFGDGYFKFSIVTIKLHRKREKERQGKGKIALDATLSSTNKSRCSAIWSNHNVKESIITNVTPL
jgi:hypothetical protein